MPPKFSHAGGANANGHIHTITALSRWSILSDKQLPSTDSISSIHIYDFDNTRAFARPRLSSSNLCKN